MNNIHNNIKLEKLFHKYKNNDFLIKDNGSVTSYFEFWIEAKQIAIKLLNIGIVEGDFLLIRINHHGRNIVENHQKQFRISRKIIVT